MTGPLGICDQNFVFLECRSFLILGKQNKIHYSSRGLDLTTFPFFFSPNFISPQLQMILLECKKLIFYLYEGNLKQWEMHKLNDCRDNIKRHAQFCHKVTSLMCIFDNEKQRFCTLCTCIFYFLTFRRRSRSFYDVKWPVLQLCGRREHIMTNVQFCALISEALFPI